MEFLLENCDQESIHTIIPPDVLFNNLYDNYYPVHTLYNDGSALYKAYFRYVTNPLFSQMSSCYFCHGKFLYTFITSRSWFNASILSTTLGYTPSLSLLSMYNLLSQLYRLTFITDID